MALDLTEEFFIVPLGMARFPYVIPIIWGIEVCANMLDQLIYTW